MRCLTTERPGDCVTWRSQGDTSDVHPTTIESFALWPSVLADLQSVVDRVAKRAGILLASGAVQPVRPDLYEVRGTEPRPYAVDLLAETCSCPDFQHGAPEYKGAKWCKHRLAALFLRHLGEKQVARQAERRTRVQVFRPIIARQRPVRIAAAATA